VRDYIKKNVKCTLAQALRLCTGRRALRGSRGRALPSHDHGTRGVWGVSVTPRPLFTPGKDPVPIVQEAGWAPGPVWTGAENFVPTGIRSPDRPARSQSLYWLRYPAHRVRDYSCTQTIASHVRWNECGHTRSDSGLLLIRLNKIHMKRSTYVHGCNWVTWPEPNIRVFKLTIIPYDSFNYNNEFATVTNKYC